MEQLLLFLVRGENGTEQRLQVLWSASAANLREQSLQAQMVIYTDVESLTAQMIEEIAERKRA
jgi:hypothetical protein